MANLITSLEQQLLQQLTDDQKNRLIRSHDQVNGAVVVFSVERVPKNYTAFDAVFSEYDDDLAHGEPATPSCST